MAAMRQLMVVEATGELGLLQVSSNVLVGHLLHACLEQVVFLSLSDKLSSTIASVLPLLQTKICFLQQTSCEHEGQERWSSGTPAQGGARESEAGGEAS